MGVRLHGTEYFYSDVIESRPVAVMQDMLEDFPQVSFDLGPATVTEAELEEWIASDALQSQWQPESYNVFDHNCNHFAKVISDKVTEQGLEDAGSGAKRDQIPDRATPAGERKAQKRHKHRRR